MVWARASERFRGAFHTPQFWLAEVVGAGAVGAAMAPFGPWAVLLSTVLGIAAIAGFVAFSGEILGPSTSARGACVLAGVVVFLMAVAFGAGRETQSAEEVTEVARGLCDSLGRAAHHGGLMLEQLNRLETMEPSQQVRMRDSVWREWQEWSYETWIVISYYHNDWANEFTRSVKERVFIPQMKPSVVESQLSKLDELRSRAQCW